MGECICEFREDGSATLLGLLTTRDATGAAAPTASDGNLIKQADLQASPLGIVIKVFDLTGATPDTALFTVTPVISTVIVDTLQTSGIWGLLAAGGNFLYDVPATLFPESHLYRIEVKALTTGGTTGWGLWTGSAKKVRSS